MNNVGTLAAAVSCALLILACGLASTPPPSGNDVATVVAATVHALTPATSTSSPTANDNTLGGVPVNYKDVSFVIPMRLAADAAPQTVPAQTDSNANPWWDLAPEHIHFTLDGYHAPADHFSVINIDVYPAQDYANVNTGANISLQRRQGVLASPSAPLTNETLPQVPYFNAASMFAAQIERIDFSNGHGVRVVTQYGQAAGPIGNFGSFYHFEGLTTDGKYYIVAVLPVIVPFLQSGSDPAASLPPGGIPFPTFTAAGPGDDNTYIEAITDKLNGTPPDQFSPPLTALDALVQSIRVNP